MDYIMSLSWVKHESLRVKKKFSGLDPPNDGEVALWSATNCWYVVKCVSQKRNQSNNKTQWYNVLVTFIFKLN